MSEIKYTEEETRLGMAAYDGYLLSSDGKSLITGDILPTYAKLPDDIKIAWIFAALSVRDYLEVKDE